MIQRVATTYKRFLILLLFYSGCSLINLTFYNYPPYPILFLCKIGIIPSPACSLCGESDESLEHLFLSCHYTKNFWSEVIKWLVDHKVKIENLSDKDILFGIIGCEEEIFVNHILLLAKQYLYSCRQNKYPPSIRVLHSKINTVFLIETMIAKSNNKLETHNMKWGKYKTD